MLDIVTFFCFRDFSYGKEILIVEKIIFFTFFLRRSKILLTSIFVTNE